MVERKGKEERRGKKKIGDKKGNKKRLIGLIGRKWKKKGRNSKQERERKERKGEKGDRIGKED